MSTLLTRSMPFCTPKTTTNTVATEKTKKKSSGCHALPVKAEKYCPAASCEAKAAVSPDANAQMYLITQPPMTQ